MKFMYTKQSQNTSGYSFENNIKQVYVSSMKCNKSTQFRYY